MTHPDPIEALRRDRAALEAEIRVTGSTIRGKACQCPHPDHPDQHPSASIHAGADGVWRVRCFSGGCYGDTGGDLYDVKAAAQRRPVADVLRDERAKYATPRPSDMPPTAISARATPDMLTLGRTYHQTIADPQRQELSDRLGVSVKSLQRLRVGWCARDNAYSFPMRNAAGQVTGIRLRRHSDDGKHSEAGGRDGIFIPAGMTGKGVLIICEGPTDLAALLDMGFDAIGRSNNNSHTAEDYICDYLTAHEYAEAWIVTDADPEESKAREQTRVAAERLASRLASIVGWVKVFTPPHPHKDVRDWMRSGADADDVTTLAESAPSRGPAGELRAMLIAEIDGTRRAIPWPWPLVTRGTQALIPGTVTMLVGEGGAGKSFLTLEALVSWHDGGLPVAAFELEQTRAYHLKRALAQRVGASWLTDIEQVAARPDEALAYQAEHEAWQNSLGRTINDAPTEPVTLVQLIDWTRAKAKAGARIIVIDPITAAETTDKPWADAQRFMHTVMPILDTYGASLVLVSHPRKGKQRNTIITMDDLAGGAAWVRFSQTILWLERHDEPKPVCVRKFADPLPDAADIRWTLRVMKARNGRGAGWQLAMDLAPDTLRFHELGAIVKANSSTHSGAE